VGKEMTAVSGEGVWTSIMPVPVRNASPVAEFHGEGHVGGRERSAVGKLETVAEMEGDFAAVAGDLPGFGESRFESLSLTINANQNATGQIADVFRGFIVHKNGIESLGLAMEAKIQFSARLGVAGRGRK
jgi:hypothetical protein